MMLHIGNAKKTDACVSINKRNEQSNFFMSVHLKKCPLVIYFYGILFSIPHIVIYIYHPLLMCWLVSFLPSNIPACHFPSTQSVLQLQIPYTSSPLQFFLLSVRYNKTLALGLACIWWCFSTFSSFFLSFFFCSISFCLGFVPAASNQLFWVCLFLNSPTHSHRIIPVKKVKISVLMRFFFPRYLTMNTCTPTICCLHLVCLFPCV